MCACTRVCKVSKKVGHMSPHTLGDCRSVSLTTGVGKVSTLLADGDWLSLSFPLFQSTADLRRCFNHSWYGTMPLHMYRMLPSPPLLPKLVIFQPPALLSVSHFQSHTCMHLSTFVHIHTHVVFRREVSLQADAVNISLEYAAKLPSGPNE